MKEDWLNRVVLIKGFDHLTHLCNHFTDWYNEFRPHSTLDGAIPDDVFHKREWKKPPVDSKNVLSNIKVKYYSDTCFTAYQLKQAA